MPEGHTVHRIANLFSSLLTGSLIRASSPQGRFEYGASIISGTTLNEVEARGKQLFLHFDADRILRVHLGIYGKWDVFTFDGQYARGGSPKTVSLPTLGSSTRGRTEEKSQSTAVPLFPPEPKGAVRLRLESPHVVADLRGPTACELQTPEQVLEVKSRLGPDPMVDKGVRAEREFLARLGSTRRPIGAVLMDQSVVSGIGNVFRAEILFRQKISPYQAADSLSREAASALWKDWTKLLAYGVKTGVMLTRLDLNQAQTKKALRSPRDRHYVYRRQGLPCRVCGSLISLEMMLARKLYFCSHCQAEVMT